jgi:hypothetical protein
MDHAILPLGVFVMVAIIVTVVMWAGVQNRREANETVRRALEAGRPLDPKVVAALMRPGWGPGQDVRRGVLLLSLAIGLAVCGYLLNGLAFPFAHPGFNRGMGFFFPAIILAALGIGRLIGALLPRRDRTDG